MMKKTILSSLLFAAGMGCIQANPVTPAVAQKVAESYYKQNNKLKQARFTLAYTEIAANGLAAYYAFNVNTSDGFVIVAADDAAHPIIGYSTKNQFVVPDATTTIGHWLKKRKVEIDELRAKNLVADETISNEWAGTFAVNKNFRNANTNATTSSTFSVAPLVQTTWNQNGGGSVGYNNLCPGGSVTGCVATTMAQIMKYWNYPTHGTGSSSYCDCTVDSLAGTPFTNTYGTLSANYGATTYSWSAMPLAASNAAVATLMYHSGVSVDMDYDPQGSGAWVISTDDSICAQTSYVKYFGYDPYTIQGLTKANFADATWVQLLQNDLINGRPIQYVGDDPAEGGHTWVCDGFDVNSNFHMNWGWAGSDDGYFYINDLNSGNGNFSTDCEALIGIEPMPPHAVDAGVLTVASPNGTLCTTTFTPSIKLQNFGSSALTSCTLNFMLDNNTLQTQSWSGSLNSGQSAQVVLPSMTTTAGTHSLTCYTSNPNGVADSNAINDQFISFFTYGVAAAFAANQTSICYVPVPVNFTNGTTNATHYNWSFGDGATDTTLNPTHTYTASGNYFVKLVSSACNGAVTDTALSSIVINTPASPTATGTVTCDSSSAILTGSGTGTLVWQDGQGNQLGTGSVFTTPTLTANTTFYVSNTNPVAAIYGGPALNTSLGAGGYLNAGHSLLFDANAAFTLLSVDIYAQSVAGSKPTIQLQDNVGNILNSFTPTVTTTGRNTITLNWPINPGTGYQLVGTGTNINLYRTALTSTSIPYPINVGTLASITGSDADAQHYYYFYNWQVQAKACSSPAVAVTATVQTCASSGIKNISQGTFEVYPNPTNGNVTLNSSLPIGVVSVYNSLGELVYQQKTTDTSLQIDLNGQAVGIYIILINNKLVKIIKQ